MSHSDVRCGFRPRRCGHIFAALLSGLLLGSGCGRSDRDRTGEFVAKVGPVTLTADELAAELDRRSRTGLPAIPPAELVEAWVHHQALLARAREAGLDRDPELRRRMERVLVARMEEPLEERLRNLESVTDAEVEEHFRTHAGEFESPEQVRVAQILFRVPPGATPEQRRAVLSRAEAVREEALNGDAAGEVFGALARRHSDDRPTRYTGGDCGWVARTATAAPWPAEVSEAVFALDHAGSVSALVESADGFRLFRLTARKAPMPRALSEVRDQIAHRLQRQRREAATRQFQESLRAGLAIQVNPAVLAAIKPASSSLAQVAQPPALPAR